MIIIKDNQGNVIGQEESQPYISTRTLRKRKEQGLCDRQLGIVRGKTSSLNATNLKRAERGLEPLYDNPGHKPCTCEDYPCCGH